MQITDLLSISAIDFIDTIETKSDAINCLVKLMAKNGNLKDIEKYKECVFKREEESTTGIGEGIAIPHAKTDAVAKAGLSLIISKNGVDFDSLDGEKAKVLFLIAAPDSEDNVHLDVLSKLSAMLMEESFKEKLLKAETKEEIIKIIDDTENNRESNEKKVPDSNDGYKILAVTACPTGIAHTFMAAEALENMAQKLNISLKVETNGSGGVKNALTKEEIEKAECIIIAADKNIEMPRFNGKRIIEVKVADGINKAEELLNDALNGKGKIYHSSGVSEEIEKTQNESVARQIYKHLMNGVSYMLPFVIGGGILIALAFLLDDFNLDPSNFGKNTPIAAFFKTTGEYAFGFMLPILAGYIAMSIADRPALAVGFVGGAVANAGGSGFLGALLAGFLAGYLVLGLKWLFDKLPKALEGTKPVLLYPFFGILIIGVLITFVVNPPVASFNSWLTASLEGLNETSKFILGFILGGMMSIDFGGPINKAAYVFGTAQIASENYDIMAAVMIGGMVPPLAVAIATVLFKNKFTKKQRQSGLTNFIMGLSFITEGVIPFAAADPLRVIPSCAIGSAIAGGLSMVFGCTLMAPHGGIFVFPVVGNKFLYLLALLIGSFIGAIILGLLKKPVDEEN